MWSEKKYVNILINVLLFCVAINIFHYGQLLLPVICLILFIDNKLQFKVNNPVIFIVLYLFAVSFYAFSYRLGFYCVMGFCLPMAYYIGSNLKDANEENIKKLIYIIAFGMATHMVLNFILELLFWHDDLRYLFSKTSHYDIWLYKLDLSLLNVHDENDLFPFVQFIKVKTTATSMNYIMISAIVYYLARYEKIKKYKYSGIVLFILASIYCLALGRRTTMFILLVSAMTCILIEAKNKNKPVGRNLLMFFLAILTVVAAVLIGYKYNLLGLKDFLSNVLIVKKILYEGLGTNRLDILMKAIALAPKYPFGGQKISSEIGSVIHDLWGDIYDYAGIIPYALFMIYSVSILKVFARIYKSRRINGGFKILLFSLFITSTVIMFVEPIMTGASIYLICYIIVVSSIENLAYKTEIVSQ